MRPRHLKIVPRKDKNPNSCPEDYWANFLLEMAKIQVELMKTGQKSARSHLLAILKEIEYTVGFRYIEIDPETHPYDPRKG